MTFVINYNKEIHDLYKYDSEPVLNWQQNIFHWAKPISFNTNLYLNSITTYIDESNLPPNVNLSEITNINFSGIVARKRGAAFFQANGRPFAQQVAFFNGFGTTMGNFEPSVQSPVNGGNVELTNALMADGWNGAYPDLINDYNHWNTGDIPGCLISPAHVLVGGHMIDPLWGTPQNSENGLRGFEEGELGDTNAPYIRLRFVGEGNTYYDKIAVLSFFLNNSTAGPGLNCQNAGDFSGVFYESPFCQNYIDNLNNNFGNGDDVNKDLAILELRDPDNVNVCMPLTNDELKHVKIYKIGNLRSWPNGSPFFMVNPQGVVLVFRKSFGDSISQSTSYFQNLQDNLNLPQPGFVQLDGLGGKTETFFSSLIWIGDSCNFAYGYYPPTGETVFLASLNSGRSWFSFDPTNNLYDYEFLKSLKQWIYQRIYDATGTGYNIDWINYNTSTQTMVVNDKIYPMYATVSAGTTQSFYSGVTIPSYQFGFTSGVTYGFLITSENSAGFSGYAGPINTRIT